MAYSNENICVVYVGDNSNLTFAITFDYVADTSVKAELWNVSDPLNPTKQPFTNPANWVVENGNVVLQVAPTLDEKLLLFRETKPLHGIEYSTYEFPYQTANVDFDTVYQIAQENRDALNRAIVNSQFAACSGGGGTVYTTDDLALLAEQVAGLALVLDPTFQTQLDNTSNAAAANTLAISTNATAIGSNSTAIGTNASAITALGNQISQTLLIVTASGTVALTSNSIVVVKSVGVILDLPATPVAKDRIVVKDRGGNSININGNGNTIDGDSAIILSSNEVAIELLFDGSEWIII